MQTHNLFPTPIVSIKVPKYFQKFVPYLEAFPHVGLEHEPTNFGTRSKNSYVLDTAPLKEFKTYLLNQVSNYAYNTLNFPKENFKLSQSWISYKHPQQHHLAHTHPNSIISGVFFWENITKKTPLITFEKKFNSGEVFQMVHKTNRENPQNPQFLDKYSIPAFPGTLLLFPSYLPHSVSLNETNKVRKSLAFNSLPQEGLGSEYELTELKFN